jgi:hypothetical protein
VRASWGLFFLSRFLVPLIEREALNQRNTRSRKKEEKNTPGTKTSFPKKYVPVTGALLENVLSLFPVFSKRTETANHTAPEVQAAAAGCCFTVLLHVLQLTILLHHVLQLTILLHHLLQLTILLHHVLQLTILLHHVLQLTVLLHATGQGCCYRVELSAAAAVGST